METQKIAEMSGGNGKGSGEITPKNGNFTS
jgi:hypothetical protein